VVGTVDFADPNGDVASLTMTVVDGSGATVDALTSPVARVSGSKSGTIQGDVDIATTTAGTFTVSDLCHGQAR
jgi:hypothetical protein